MRIRVKDGVHGRRVLAEVNRERPCPICRHTHWCYWPDVEGHPDWVVCMRTPSAHPVRAGGWVHTVGQSPPEDVRGHPPAARPAPLARRHQVYTALAAVLTLTPEHAAALQRRGLSEAAIQANGYRSLPADPGLREAIAAQVAAAVGTDALRHVPGVYRTAHGAWTLAGPPGLLIPVRAVDERIQGWQIRRDAAAPGPRYVWWSSAPTPRHAHPEGASSGAPVHVTRGALQRLAARRRLWITEGPLKADVAAAYLADPVLAVPGVTTWRAVPGLLVRRLPAAHVLLAFDADVETNPHVAQALEALTTAVLEDPRLRRVRLWWVRWDGALGKGLDDVLHAGHRQALTLQPVAREAVRRVMG